MFRIASRADPGRMDHTVPALGEALDWGDPVASDGTFLLPTGTVTMLLADVEGSTRRWEQDEEAMAEATAAHSALIDEEVAAHHGVRPLEQGEGDSFVAAFARPSDAVACALAIARTAPLPVRMAVHTGEAHRTDEGNYVGPSLNRAGRLRDAAHGGQIVLSHGTAELVGDRLPKGGSLRDLGRHRLKDLDRPERIFQLVHPDLRRDFPPLRTLDTYRHNLPQQRTALFGRRHELAAVEARLRSSRLVTITGAGGCGKTRLSLELAARLLDDRSDGVYFVDLTPQPSDAAVADLSAAVGQALGLSDEAANDPLAFLRGRRTLLVLDNCEHVVRAAAALVDRLLAESPELTVLATSREVLGVEGETTFVLPSLPVPPPGPPEGIRGLRSYAAAELFLDRARRGEDSFEPSPEDVDAIAEICRRLDGIPLAIELAAARVRVLSPREIAGGLDERFELLTGGPRTALPRQQTLRASVDWSHQLLSDDERVVLRRAAVFAGSFALDAAVAACAAPPVGRHQILDLVSLLVDKSLVVVDRGATGTRYRLLDTIRRYGLERLREAGEEEETRRRHRDHHLATAEADLVALWGPEGIGVMERLAADRSDHDLAFRWSMERGDDEAVIRFATVFAEVDSLQWIGAPQVWFDVALPLLDRVPEVVRLPLLYTYARHLLKIQAPPPAAITAAATTALDGADPAAGRASTIAAVIAVALGVLRGDEAVARALEAAAEASAAGDVATATVAQIAAWRAARAAGRRDATELARDIAPIVAGGGPLLRASALAEFGAYLHSATAALEAAETVLTLGVERLPNVHRHTVRDTAFALEGLGRHDEAAELAEQIYPGFHENGDRNCGGWMLEVMSHREEARGDLDAALALAERSCQEVRGTPLWDTFSPPLLVRLCALHLVRGDPAASAAALASVDDVPEDRRGPFHRPFRALGAALSAIAAGEPDEEAAHRVLEEAWTGDCPILGTAVTVLGVVMADRGRDPEGAARLLGAGASIAAAVGDRARWKIVDDLRADAESALATRLGEEVLDRLLGEGRLLTVEEVVAYARRGRGERRRPSSGWESLTPMEERVVRLVAEGLPNAAIAERLFVSVRTVTTHLTHVYAKVGVGSRSELAVTAAARWAPGDEAGRPR
jgi:predicted ATPase/class 3 adenylate cyclase/DNA-binding CsgD family transcriptional regulator